MPSPPLKQLECSVLRVQPSLAALPHVADLLSAFLDGSTSIPLIRAAASGSPSLLERVFTRLQDDSAVDPVLISYWLGQALMSAIQRNDLVMAKTIHGLHPRPLAVRSLGLAIEFGSLETVQWVVNRRRNRRCCVEGIQNFCKRYAYLALKRQLHHADAWRVLRWLARGGAIDVSHPKVMKYLKRHMTTNEGLLRWCHERGHLDEKALVKVLFEAIKNGPPDAITSIKYLIANHVTLSQRQVLASIVHIVCKKGMEDVIEVVLASHLCDFLRGKFVFQPTRPGGRKVLQWDLDALESSTGFAGRRLGSMIVRAAAPYGHVDTLHWITDLRPRLNCSGTNGREVPDEDDLVELYEWMKSSGRGNFSAADLCNAAQNGQMKVIKWLHAIKPDLPAPSLVNFACKTGLLPVLQWFYVHGEERCDIMAAQIAAEYGHLHVV